MIDPAAREALVRVQARVRALWAPPSDQTISQWVAVNRYMPQGSTSRPGRWVSDPWQVEIMDQFNNPAVRVVVFVKCTQIGGTEILNNTIAFVIAVQPQPMMMVRPTAEDAREYGRQRFSVMVKNCPAVRERVSDVKEKRDGNTLRMKQFPGGFLKLSGANAGSGLRSEPLGLVMADEIDGYPDDVDKEGDPIELIKRRLDSFGDASKLLLSSTPAKPRGASRIEREFLKSDQRYYHVPCPHCGAMQPLQWRDPETKDYRLRFDRLKDGRVDRDSVRYVCAHCGQGIEEKHKQQMLDAGRWIAKVPEHAGAVGFHINALYANWKQDLWADLAQEWIDAQGNQELLRTFINLRLGETFEEQGETVEAGILAKRRETYTSEVPAGVGALVLSVDVQHNRIEALITGFGEREQSWIIKHEVFWGDPGLDAPDNVWSQLEQLRLQPLTCAAGRKTTVDITLVDSGDQTDSVYDFVAPRQNSTARVFAIKGVDYHAKPILVQESGIRKKTIRLFTVATYPAKDRIYSRLRLAAPETGTAAPAGYIHLPEWTTDEFLAQITGEKKIPVLNRRTKTNRYVWVKTHGSNEALDLTVYALAGLHVLQEALHRKRDLAAAAALLASPPDPEGKGKPPQDGGSGSRGPGGSWVGGNRGGGWLKGY